ncbi:MAG: SpoIIE family protein phosphatase, partial [Pseudomonadota bacterium]|nr:SpoIIE family protein phosphatase [Pseudomonadota bacterium]
MVSHTFKLKPFTSQKGCGDFVCVFERDNDLLFALGDVGGHGSIEVGNLAEKMRAWLNENYQLAIKELFDGLSKIEGVEKFGATVFLGRVDTAQSLLHYMSIGDVKAFKIASTGIKNLSTQQGVLGFTAPSSMKEFVTNLNQNDGIVVTSDGVTSFNDALSDFSMSSVETVCGHIISQYAKKDDDASCLVLKMEGGKSKRKALDSPMVESGVTQEEYNRIEAPDSIAAKITAKQLSPQNSSLEVAHQRSPDFIALPDENTFFCVLDSQLAARKKIRELK